MFHYAHSGINLAGILGDIRADPEDLVGVRGGMWGEGTPTHQGRSLGRGQCPSPEKNDFSLEIVCFDAF